MNVKEELAAELSDLLDEEIAKGDIYWPSGKEELLKIIHDFLISKGMHKDLLPEIILECDEDGIISIEVGEYPELPLLN
jgi:hypothetical protein